MPKVTAKKGTQWIVKIKKHSQKPGYLKAASVTAHPGDEISWQVAEGIDEKLMLIFPKPVFKSGTGKPKRKHFKKEATVTVPTGTAKGTYAYAIFREEWTGAADKAFVEGSHPRIIIA